LRSVVVQGLASKLAMHVVAVKPTFLSRDKVDSADLDKELDILRTQVCAWPATLHTPSLNLACSAKLSSWLVGIALLLHPSFDRRQIVGAPRLQAQTSGKPPQIIEKIVQGRLNKCVAIAIQSQQRALPSILC
jgi:translation elongation factor EF-Ts